MKNNTTLQDDNRALTMPHNLILEERKKLSVSGVTDVDSFDEQTVIAYTVKGEITVRGWDLHINKLNLEQGELTVEGEISSLTYTDVKPKTTGLFSKLLR